MPAALVLTRASDADVIRTARPESSTSVPRQRGPAVLGLQASAGNRAVRSMLTKPVQRASPGPDARPSSALATLFPGAVGPTVELLQRTINATGMAVFDTLTVDGQYGPNTIGAVKGFQAVSSLEEDAIVGPATWQRLAGFSQEIDGHGTSTETTQIDPTPTGGGALPGGSFDCPASQKSPPKRVDSIADQSVGLRSGGVPATPPTNSNGEKRTRIGWVYFSTESAKLEPGARKALNDIVAKATSKDTSHEFDVEGFTDIRGTASINRPLSGCRADVTKVFLRDNIRPPNISPVLARAVGHGAVAGSNAHMRRADVIYVGDWDPKVTKKPDECENYDVQARIRKILKKSATYPMLAGEAAKRLKCIFEPKLKPEHRFFPSWGSQMTACHNAVKGAYPRSALRGMMVPIGEELATNTYSCDASDLEIAAALAELDVRIISGVLAMVRQDVVQGGLNIPRPCVKGALAYIRDLHDSGTSVYSCYDMKPWYQWKPW